MFPGFKLHDPARRGRGYRSARCPGCLQLPVRCVCALLTPRATRVRVVVVMHGTEISRPTNTGRLAVCCLSGAELVLRGRRDQPAVLPALDPARSALLFPREDAQVLGDQVDPGSIDTLVVPDGTWSQTRRTVRRQAPLPELRAVRLPAGRPSMYALRQGPEAGSLCTLEAIARALGILDRPALEAELLGVLEAVVQAGLFRRGMHKSQAVE